MFVASACRPAQSLAQSDGWGILVNRTAEDVVVHVGDSRIGLREYSLRPNESVRVTDCKVCEVTLGQDEGRHVFNATPLYIPFQEDSVDKIVQPEWKSIEQGVNQSPPPAWAMRFGQILKKDSKPYLVQGFTNQDVDAVLSRYRRRMDGYGFEVDGEALVATLGKNNAQEDLLPRTNIGAEATKEASAELMAFVARRVQDGAFAESILEVVECGARQSILGGELPLAIVTRAELEKVATREDRPNVRDRLKFDTRKVFVSLNTMELSPEIHTLIRMSVAKLLSISADDVAVDCIPPAGRAPQASLILKGEFVNNEKGNSDRVHRATTNIINQHGILKRFQFSPMEISSHSRAWDHRNGVILRQVSAWRYKDRDDSFELVGAVPKMDLRWRVVLEVGIWGPADFGDQPDAKSHLIDVTAKIDFETKRMTLGIRDYKRWDYAPMEMWVTPKDSMTSRYDIVAMVFLLQNTIAEHCGTW